ncbi:MAG: hypothetical protein K0Q79_1102 [Flavipsychrobacter sp.]|jgi:hypothetical protein|nr:hypothetical protein [Flavipsychrobacter sp.]
MDKLMVLDTKTKNRMGIICFIPVMCFFLCFVYYLSLIIPNTGGNFPAYSLETVTSQNYDTLFFMLAASAIITAPVFIYCLVVLARMKNMNSAIKLEWIIFLSVMAPIASALFWLFIIKDAPKYVGVHPDIA